MAGANIFLNFNFYTPNANKGNKIIKNKAMT